MQTKLHHKLLIMVFDPTSPTKHINRRLLLALHQDGLLDILAGLIVITFCIIPLLDESGMGAGLRQVIFLSLYGIELGIVLMLKRRITFPRAGLVHITRSRRRKISLILLILNLGLFSFFVANYIFDFSFAELLGPYQLSILLGLAFMLLLSVSGIMIRAPRFLLFGILVFLSFVGSEYLFLGGKTPHHGIPLAGFVSGGVMVLTGLFLLMSFIRKYKPDNQ